MSILEMPAPKRSKKSGKLSSESRLQQIESELWRRRCKEELGAWCIEAQRHEGFLPARHHSLLINILEGVVNGGSPIIPGPLDRVMINMPPGSAKSRYTTELTPPYALQRHPRWNIIGASHTGELAETFSGRVQNYIRDNDHVLDYGLANEAVGRWRTTKGGQYLAAGVGGALPGYRADLVIIDDPIKGREAADSAERREKAWKWFWGDLRHRLKPGGRIILMHTRWHEDDLAGRLLAAQPDRWQLFNLAAVAESGEYDPLGREPGEFLWSDPDDPYNFGNMLRDTKTELEKVGATREWYSQFMGKPRPAEGSLFKVGKIEIIEPEDIPPNTTWVRAWDIAATAASGTNDPDYTVGVKLGRTSKDEFIIGHVVALRGGPDTVEQAIVGTAKLDGRNVKVGIPQDPGQAGKGQVLYFTRKLVGYPVASSPETGDKATRAGPPASQCNVGNMKMVRGEWNAQMRDELAAFPAGKHDDHVDALSRGFSMLDSNVLSVWRRAAGLPG